MNPYFGPIEDLTLQNTNFRQVLFTGTYCQLVVMNLKPGEEIGSEVHQTVDQFFRVEKGQGKVVVGEGEEHLVKDGDTIVIPAGTQHNVINISMADDLKLYTIYSPPNHPEGTIHMTKAEAMAAEAAHHEGTETPAPVANEPEEEMPVTEEPIEPVVPSATPTEPAVTTEETSNPDESF